ncbi:hypothetical protein Skr01_50390 [Sphaerisporangium krabiense]|nr:hypothetical protein Skr01_50390 [Sphaerisporangium krabiense]
MAGRVSAARLGPAPEETPPRRATGEGPRRVVCQSQVTSTTDTTVHRTRSESLALTGSTGSEAVRVAVKV